MSRAAHTFALFLLCAAGAAAPFDSARAQIDILTERYDAARLGANLQETELTTANVNVGSFGKLWSYTVSGSVYAQPLYVRNVTIPGQGTHNVLYVVTMNDMLYAFDADSSTDVPLISFDVTSEVAGSIPVPINDIVGGDNIIGNVGIESTPVIDLSTSTMYFLARTKETATGGCGGLNPTYCQRLHAVDMTTFEERPGSPVMIGGSVPCNPSAGGGECGSNGVLLFNTKIEDQRSSLALSNGRIFIAWSSHSDQHPYHGWVMAYDATTLTQNMIWSSAPDGPSFNGAGVWMGGRAPVIDADGNVYYMTGNGTWDGVTNFGESFVKFGPTPDSPLLDWFTPDEWDFLNQADLDLAGSGPILVPGADLIIGGGKSGIFYVTHTSDMGHESNGDLGAVEVFDNSIQPRDFDQIKGGPVYWNRDTSGGTKPWLYVWSDNCNHFNAYEFDVSNTIQPFNPTPISQSTLLSHCGSSGGVLTLSANGSTPGTGIVWASMPPDDDGNSGIHHGMLRAFDADDLSTELWNSDQDLSGRDNAGNWPKFSPPTVVNGHVYLGSFPSDGVLPTKVNVYGLLAPSDFSLLVTPPNPGVMPGGSVDYIVSIDTSSGFSGTVHFAVGGLPPGATASFSSNDVTPPAQTTLTISTSTSTPLGESLITLTANGGSVQHTAANGLYVTNTAAGAGIISINFVGSQGTLQPIDVAGVSARPNWVDASGTSGAGLELFDESEGDTGATLDWTADADGELAIAGNSADFVMMNGYIDGTTAAFITVANLPADPRGYFVYVYADGFNGGNVWAADYALAGNDGSSRTTRIVDAANTTFDGTYVFSNDGPGNYAVFFTGGTGFTLTATPNEGGHAPVNGIQILRGDRIFSDGFDP